MTWPLILVGLLWFAGWSFFVARLAASRDGDVQVTMYGTVLPLFSAVTLLLLFAAVRERGPVFQLVLWIHHAAIVSLFLFLLTAQLFQVEAWWQIRGNLPAKSVGRTMRQLWVLTEVAPASIAVVILLTGLRLVWESPAISPDSLWLVGLIVSFSFFFFDGILGYQPVVRKMRAYWDVASEKEIPVAIAAREWRATSDQVQLFVHFLSWPFVFMPGVYRWNPPNPFSPQVAHLERFWAFLPEGWAGVMTALVLWGFVGALVALMRVLARVRGMNARPFQ